MEKKSSFFDFIGKDTGLKVDKKMVMFIGIAILCYLIGTVLPLDAYGPKAGEALGLMVGLVVIMASGKFPLLFLAFMVALSGIFAGFWTSSDVKSQLGSGQFYTVLGILIVAAGATQGNFGKRLAYSVLKRFSSKPVMLIIVFAGLTCVLSAFLSNVPLNVLMSAIVADMLVESGEKPGESSIGRTLMLLVAVMSMVGGTMLINGNPNGNAFFIGLLEDMTNGAYTVDYATWAMVGIPCTVIGLVPICFIYLKCSGFKAETVTLPKQEFFEEKLKGLGKMENSEYRWLIILTAMVVCMFMGFDITTVALSCAFVAMLPGIGVVKPAQIMRGMPIPLLISISTFPLMGKLFTTTGLSDFISEVCGGFIPGSSPLVFCIFATLLIGIMENVMVNVYSGVHTIYMAFMLPICLSFGYNPVPMLIPAMFLGSYFFVFGVNGQMMLNYSHGFWKMKDTILPGVLTIIFCSIVYPIICIAMCSMMGISLYI